MGAAVERPVPPGFVALDDEVSVDPNDVRLIAADRAGTRVYLRDGGRAYLEVDRPIDQVMKSLARRP